MVDQPLTLATFIKFHQEILLPEVRQLVREEVSREVGGLRQEMHGAFDGLAQRFDRLETKSHMLVAGVKRIEQRLDGVVGQVDRVALKSGVLALKSREETLERRLSELDD